MAYNLKNEAERVKNESTAGANTAERVGTWMEQASDEISGKASQSDLNRVDQLADYVNREVTDLKPKVNNNTHDIGEMQQDVTTLFTDLNKLGVKINDYAIDKIVTNWTDALTSKVGVSFDDGGGVDNNRPAFLPTTGQYNILPFAHADGEPSYLIHNRSGNKFYLYNPVDSAYLELGVDFSENGGKINGNVSINRSLDTKYALAIKGATRGNFFRADYDSSQEYNGFQIGGSSATYGFYQKWGAIPGNRFNFADKVYSTGDGDTIVTSDDHTYVKVKMTGDIHINSKYQLYLNGLYEIRSESPVIENYTKDYQILNPDSGYSVLKINMDDQGSGKFLIRSTGNSIRSTGQTTIESVAENIYLNAKQGKLFYNGDTDEREVATKSDLPLIIPQISVRKFHTDDIRATVNLDLIKPLRQYNPCVVFGRVVDRRRNYNKLNGSEYVNYATKKIAYPRPEEYHNRPFEFETFLSPKRDFICKIPSGQADSSEFSLRRISDNKAMFLEDFIKPFVIKNTKNGTAFPDLYYRISGSKKSHDSVLPNILPSEGNGLWAKARFCFNIRIDNPLYTGHPGGSEFERQKRYLYGDPFPVTMGIKYNGYISPDGLPYLQYVMKIGW